jgi:hypothetical protein
MDAHACFTGSSVGLSQSPITALPTAIAPEETKTTSFPEFLISIRSLKMLISAVLQLILIQFTKTVIQQKD